MATYSNNRKLLQDCKKPKHNQICFGLASKSPKRLRIIAHFESAKIMILLIAVA